MQALKLKLALIDIPPQNFNNKYSNHPRDEGNEGSDERWGGDGDGDGWGRGGKQNNNKPFAAGVTFLRKEK